MAFVYAIAVIRKPISESSGAAVNIARQPLQGIASEGRKYIVPVRVHAHCTATEQYGTAGYSLFFMAHEIHG